ncbi:Gfo/Idh/MocA family protein [Halobacillus sp. Marseille-Q1614]|uniref:Gfo/Idh/MocA family protein n=1 Tax=Halobacillus sp. Marseille-Q1614 TaxID=2709134 RepID=UPI00156E6FF0|nr:Gfo/Idh/MocA family oxidoreductase [Halobacillus sp. Marseille-Q1614]
MKIGIISFAHMHAYSYANALINQDDVEIAGIYDSNHERGKEASSQFNTDFHQSIDDLLATDIEAVVVTSENIYHREHVTAAAKAKKHILCEKPIATTIEDANAMIEICEENGVLLQTAFPVRFSSAILRAKSIIEEGELGDILAIKGTNRGTNPGGWFNDKELSGGGAVIDHTVHVVDVMRWILKSEVTEVYAEIDHLISEKPIDDSGILTMEFDNGLFATLDCSWSRNDAYPTWGDVTLEIVGTEGTLSVDAFAQKIDIYSNESGVNWSFWGDDMNDHLVADFVEAVRENRAPSITGEDGLKAVEVALKAYESSEKKEPVHL